jgi:hypothetical protein
MAARKKVVARKPAVKPSAAKPQMHGQWIGRYSGTNAGDAILDLDVVGTNLEGWVYIYDDRQELPPLAAFVVIPSGATNYSNPELALTPLDPRTFDFTTWPQLKDRLPDINVPTKANTDWILGDDIIQVTWKSDIGTGGQGTLHRVDGNSPSALIPLNITSWDEFRRHVRDLKPYKFMFRGQGSNKWRLRTAFHRN